MSALEEYNAARVGMPTSIQTVVNQRKADAAINELLAEVDRLMRKRVRTARRSGTHWPTSPPATMPNPMTDLDKAREEYKDWKRRGDETGGTQQEADEWPYVAVKYADVLIAALEAEVERVNERLAYAEGAAYDVWMKRAEQAEAKLAALEARVEELSGDLKATQNVLQFNIEKRQQAEAERDRLKRMLVRSVCDECLVHKSGACSEEEGEDCPPVRDTLADLAARYDARHEDGDG